jgi:N-acetylmuramic acid 6-phosphate etherase
MSRRSANAASKPIPQTVPPRPRRRAQRYSTSGLNGSPQAQTPPEVPGLGSLPTEQANPAAADLDLKSTSEILHIINREDSSVAEAVGKVIPQIARAVDFVVESFHRGGRLIYVGAGTSGRLGVLDASECPPTFNVSPQLVVGVIAGGTRALHSATEASEDDPYLGRRDLRRLRVSDRDTVVGIAASGRTPYTIGAVEYARSCGAHTVALVCAKDSPLARAAELAIEPMTGPEVIAGSTRMKAGTAQKLVLNMLSTAAMVRTGHVFGNLMVNVKQNNRKLIARAERILAHVTGVSAGEAQKLLSGADYDLKVAIVMQMTRSSIHEARENLQAVNGNLREALRRGAPTGK